MTVKGITCRNDWLNCRLVILHHTHSFDHDTMWNMPHNKVWPNWDNIHVGPLPHLHFIQPLSSSQRPIMQMPASHVLTLQRLPQQPVPQQPLPPALIAEQLGHSIWKTHNTLHTSFPVGGIFYNQLLCGVLHIVFGYTHVCLQIFVFLVFGIEQSLPSNKRICFSKQTTCRQSFTHANICNCVLPLFPYYFNRGCLIT